MASESIIKVLIKGEEFDLKRATESAHHDLEKVGDGHKKFAKVAKVAMAAAGVAAIEFVKSSVEVASRFQEAHDRMDQAFRVTGVEGGKWVKDAEKQGQKFGYTRDKIDNALASSVRALGNAKTAHKALNVAEDIAAATGMDLQDATMMVTKATEGNTKSLKKLGIEWTGAAGGAKAVAAAQAKIIKATDLQNKAQTALDVVQMKIKGGVLKGAAANFALMAAQDKLRHATDGVKLAQLGLKAAQEAGGKIVDLLAKKHAGSASDAAKTFEGRVKNLKAGFTNFEATVGKKVIPILMKVMDWFTKNKIALYIVAGALAALVAGFIAFKVGEAAMKAWTVATKIATAAQKAFDIVMDANPIILVVAAIAVLAAGVIYAYTHFKWFHNFVQKAWEILQTGFNWVKKHWPLLLAILTGPIGLAVFFIVSNFDHIKNVAMGALNWVKEHWPLLLAILTGPIGLAVLFIVNNFSKIRDFIALVLSGISSAWSSVWNGMKSAISTIWNGIVGIIKGSINTVISLVNGIINLLDAIQVHVHIAMPGAIPNIDVNWDGLKIPRIPYLHTGGVFDAGGRGEGLAMLKNGEGVFTPEQMRALGSDATVRYGGNTYITLPSGVDPGAVIRAQKSFDRRNGVSK